MNLNRKLCTRIVDSVQVTLCLVINERRLTVPDYKVKFK